MTTNQTWQPIETAPKDGTSIIVAGGTVEWRIDSYATTNSTGPIGGWFSHSAQRYLQWRPTHWMPLPQHPLDNHQHDGVE